MFSESEGSTVTGGSRVSQERITHLDRMISKLRKEQDGLLEEYNTVESIIVEYEREADGLEAVLNEESYGGTSND